ncbi:MAG: hypothetical protein RBS56_01090 [Candidatus Gracilibacteria bacterium]|jgi:hypothetical protein|nr:hypothetical protein [Candidatus Gracilibacteria bacterium]
MSDNLYLVEVNFGQPYVSVSIPNKFIKSTAFEKNGYRVALGAGFMRNEEFDTTSFYKNIFKDVSQEARSLTDVSQEVRRFFDQFFTMLDSMQAREPDLPISGTWMANIETFERCDEIVKVGYLEFKTSLLKVISSY